MAQTSPSSTASSMSSEQGGYSKLAKHMGDYPEIRVFRSFKELNMLNLLRLQAQIQELEADLSSIREEDRVSGDDVRNGYDKDFRLMADFRDTNDPLQIMKLEKIGQKLVEYNSALLQARQVSAIKKPSEREVVYLERWLRRPNGGNNFLKDREKDVYESFNDLDFVTLAASKSESDAFTSLVGGVLLDVYHKIEIKFKRKQSPSSTQEPGFRHYDDAKIMAVGKIVGAVVSSTLPTMTILVLYFVHRPLVRIGLVIVFTAVFAACLVVFTSAKKQEIFAAVAAFAAVEVVFIGSATTPTG